MIDRVTGGKQTTALLRKAAGRVGLLRLCAGLAAGVMCAGLSGCLALASPREGMARELVATPESYSALYYVREEPSIDGWLLGFGDATLIELVYEAIERNYDLYRAAAVREQAIAAIALSRSRLVPRLDGVGLVEWEEDTKRYEELLAITPAVSWEVDLWGRLRAGMLASAHDAEAATLEYAFLRQSIAALVAETWFTAIAARKQVAISLELVQSEEATAKATASRVEAGAGVPLDHDFAQANLAFARAELAQREAEYFQVIRTLELLLGRYPNAALEATAEFPEMPELPGVGIPLELLERRPDLVAAEARVAAAFYRREASRLARLPQLRLFAAGGVQVSPAEGIWTLAADIFAPLFTGGEITAQIDIATAQQRASMAEYVQQALSAFREVENALSNHRYLEQRERDLLKALRRLSSANATAEARYEAGVLTIFDLNQVRQNYYRAQSQLVSVQLDLLRQRILLHLALGGGFDDSPVSGIPAASTAEDAGSADASASSLE